MENIRYGSPNATDKQVSYVGSYDWTILLVLYFPGFIEPCILISAVSKQQVLNVKVA